MQWRSSGYCCYCLQFVPGRFRACTMTILFPGASDFQTRVSYLSKVQQAFLRMNDYGFVALSAADGSTVGQAGCRFSLESEFGFLVGRPLRIECFSMSPHTTRWITRTLLSILSNMGLQEVFDTYYGPNLDCSAICDEAETVVEIN